MANVRKASMKDDPRICALARQSKYTRDFASIMYVRNKIEQLYDERSVGVASGYAGFICVPHGKRQPWSTIYYMGVDEKHRRSGIGYMLIEWAVSVSPHGVLRLVCEKENAGALAFYKNVGFKTYEEGASRGGHEFFRMELRA